MDRKSNAFSFARGLVGAAIGGAVGYFLFAWIARQGFYAGLVPAAFVGIGFSLACRRGSVAGGVLCGLLGIAAGLLSEWCVFPFVKDESFLFFMAHVHELRRLTLIMIAGGGLLGFWFAKGGRKTGRIV